MLVDYLDKVMMKNAARDVNTAPETYRDHIRCLKTLLRDANCKQEAPTVEEVKNSGGGGGGGSGGGSEGAAIKKLQNELKALKRNGGGEGSSAREPKKRRVNENKVGRPIWDR